MKDDKDTNTGNTNYLCSRILLQQANQSGFPWASFCLMDVLMIGELPDASNIDP